MMTRTCLTLHIPMPITHVQILIQTQPCEQYNRDSRSFGKVKRRNSQKTSSMKETCPRL
uniref:Uncharacterized protein n=1 Tax=Rhizophora mucronata TaxID=61149 RepID=A0A2P2N2Y4_RHIMU